MEANITPGSLLAKSRVRKGFRLTHGSKRVVVRDSYALSAGGAQATPLLDHSTQSCKGAGPTEAGQQPGTASLRGPSALAPGPYLLLVPLEVWDEDKAIGRVWVLKNNPVSFSLLVKNVIHPLEGEKERVYKSSYTDWDLPRKEKWSSYKWPPTRDGHSLALEGSPLPL